MSHVAPPPLPAEIDVLVAGGGILGTMLAWHLARDGVGVAVVDKGTHAGSTANAGSLHVQMQSRFIRLETPARVAAVRRHLPLYVAATTAWQELATVLDDDIELIVEGGLMLAETQEQYEFLAEKCAGEKRLGLDVHMLSAAEVRRVAPYLGDVVTGAEFCLHEGKMNTLLANPAIERAARRAGAVIVRPAAVVGAARAGAGIAVETDRGPVRCGRFVNAAGSGAGAIAAMLGYPLPVEGEPLHINVSEPVAPMMKHLVQHADRQLTLKQAVNGNVIIGGGRPAFVDPESGLPAVYRRSIEGNLALAIHIAPWLAGARLIRTWAGINAKTDGLPVLGAVPGRDGHFVAVSGDAGYSLGPISARLLADAMQGRDPGYDIADFTPARFAER
jgi:glycine/D-amino acid oxidase-like deaminating enzyme